MRVQPAGEHAALLDCADLAEALRLHEHLWVRTRPEGLVDCVPGAQTVLLVAASVDALGGVVAAARAVADAVGGPAGTDEAEPAAAAGTVDVEVPVHYDGPDLAEVSRHTGLTEDEVVTAHTGTPWTVGFGGFAPGFAYLADGDPRLVVPRREQPRARVPAGAVGLAGRFSGIYPRSSPGGWQLIGRTDVRLWDLDADPPALLRPGMRVRFVDAVGAGPASLATGTAAPPHAAPPHAATAAVAGPSEHPAHAVLEVLSPGPLTLVEDAGRPGLADLGVGTSGAADHSSFALGARLLGQDVDKAALECHGGGLALRAHGSVTVVLTGAPAGATVDGTPVGDAAPFLLPDEAVLRLGPASAGVRTYVSVRGGIDVSPVLGSRSYDTLSGIGPAPLEEGLRLPVGRPTGVPAVDVAPVATPSTGTLTLSMTPGPRLDWVADPDTLTGTAWRVDPKSDRVGVRLTGGGLARAPAVTGRELPSEGVVRGGLQVPADGRPVVFLADHPVTGGYPVVAVLTHDAVDALAQAVPGQEVRLRWR